MSSKWIWLLVAVARSAAGCPEGFRSFNEKCYIFTEEKGSMTQCQDRICSGLGATLAVIHDIDTQFFLVNLTQEFQGPAYVGLFERGVNESGDWTWVDGSNFSFEPDANGTQYPLAGWALSEPDNWCLDEDCAALGVEFLPNYSARGIPWLSSLFAPLKSKGLIDISCNTQLHCLCQEGQEVSEDFVNWEFNNSALNNENSLHVNATYLQNYMTCFFKRTRCWWYNNQTFQGSFLGLGFLCLGCLIYSMTGCQEGAKPAVTLGEASASSNYGQLLEACDRQNEVDSMVDRWIVKGSWASMLYGILLVGLSVSTVCHVNFGIGFGFGVDGLLALAMCGAQVIISASACMVQKHLSTPSRMVVAWWVLAFALAKVGMAIGDLILAVMYVTETLGGFVRENASFCSAGYLFCWMLMVSMVCQSVAGMAIARIHTRAAQHMGGISSLTKIIGCSGLLFIVATFGAGLGLGVCCGLFIFDDSSDAVDPMFGIAFSYFAAALFHFLAGAGSLRANTQVRTHYQRGARTITEMQNF
ncbi:Fcer2 [Symbiodinium microadriaticum]|nr:Fcer2 [Symbiodinium microadriaticum]